MDSISFAVAFVAGLLSFLSPCVLPLVPAYLGFISGMSYEDLQDNAPRRAVLVPAAFFVLGFSLIFLLLGASATVIGQLFRQYQDWIARIGGVVIVLFGLHLIGVFRFSALLRERRLHLSSSPKGYVGASLAGMAFGAGWTPCIGPVLGTILTMSAAQGDRANGMALLSSYALGLGVPFIASAFFTHELVGRMRALRSAGRWLQGTAGVLMIVMGVAMITGQLSRFGFWLLDTFPAFGRIG